MKTNYKDTIRYRAAQKRMKDIKGFYTHLLIYVFVNIAIFVVDIRYGDYESITDLSNYATIFFWGIGLFAHWASVFGPNFIFGKNWEEKKIKEILERDNKQLWK